MKFRTLLFNRVESDAGFRIKIRIFSGYVDYREGKRVARIPIEVGSGAALALLYDQTPVKWNPPYESESVSEERRREILKNVVAALQFRKISVKLLQAENS